jgi:hypothetical protein
MAMATCMMYCLHREMAVALVLSCYPALHARYLLCSRHIFTPLDIKQQHTYSLIK